MNPTIDNRLKGLESYLYKGCMTAELLKENCNQEEDVQALETVITNIENSIAQLRARIVNKNCPRCSVS